jgi:hypothetical protein
MSEMPEFIAAAASSAIRARPIADVAALRSGRVQRFAVFIEQLARQNVTRGPFWTWAHFWLKDERPVASAIRARRSNSANGPMKTDRNSRPNIG